MDVVGESLSRLLDRANIQVADRNAYVSVHRTKPFECPSLVRRPSLDDAREDGRSSGPPGIRTAPLASARERLPLYFELRATHSGTGDVKVSRSFTRCATPDGIETSLAIAS
jgi:hypothetical protein